MAPHRNHPNFYEILGVEQSASTDDVRRAYRKKALETHPDKLEPSANEEDKQAAEGQFHKVHEAFETLCDSQKRRRYDARLAIRSDPQLSSEESARRMADRKDWACRQQEESRKRMEAFEAKLRQERDDKKRTQAKVEGEASKVAEILQEMINANPEFAARRKAVLQRKAERERAQPRAQNQPIPA